MGLREVAKATTAVASTWNYQQRRDSIKIDHHVPCNAAVCCSSAAGEEDVLGQVLKSSAMRLGQDAMIFTFEQEFQQGSVAFLSQNYLREAAAEAAAVQAPEAAGEGGSSFCPDAVPVLTWERSADGRYKVRRGAQGLVAEVWQNLLQSVSLW